MGNTSPQNAESPADRLGLAGESERHGTKKINKAIGVTDGNANMLQHALDYAQAGTPVFPCCERDETEVEYKARLKQMPEGKRGEAARWKCKQPRITGGFKGATRDKDQIRKWWTKWPDASIGMPTGPASVLWVLDVDQPNGQASLDKLQAENGPLPATRRQKTGGGGSQFFFVYPEGCKIKNSTSKLGPNLDVRGEGGYVILPPSGHKSGQRYHWVDKDQKPAEAPKWLLDLVCERLEQAPKPSPNALTSKSASPAAGSSPYGRKALENEAAKVAGTAMGERNHALNQAAFAVGSLVAGGELDQIEAEGKLIDAALTAGLPEAEARRTIASGMTAGVREPRQAPSTVLHSLSYPTGENLDEWEPALTSTWPILKADALPGIVGDFVSLATENSEADPAAVLATFLPRFGAEVYGYEPGKGPYLQIGDTRHFPRLFMVIVGSTAKARKGTSGAPVNKLFSLMPGIDNYVLAQSTGGPLSTGEGLAFCVRDEISAWQIDKKTKAGEWVVIDPGVPDKRLFVLDEELATALICMKREGNTLSSSLRALWDSGNYSPLTKKERTKTTGANVNIVTHITRDELHRRLDDVDISNGVANRFLWICAKRPKLVAHPVPMPENELQAISHEVLRLIRLAQGRGEIKIDHLAREYWGVAYPGLTRDHPGMAGAVINRGEAQTLRLAMIYALLDGRDVISPAHLEAALAFWDYARASALHIFGNRSADPLTEKVLLALKDGPMTLTEIHRILGGHTDQAKLKQALTNLEGLGRIEHTTEAPKGRKKNIFRLCENSENCEYKELGLTLKSQNSLISPGGEEKRKRDGELADLEIDLDNCPDEVTI